MQSPFFLCRLKKTLQKVQLIKNFVYLCVANMTITNKTKIMKIVNSKDLIKNGEFVGIVKEDKTYICKFFFNDYENDEDCIKAAENVFILLKNQQNA